MNLGIENAKKAHEYIVSLGEENFNKYELGLIGFITNNKKFLLWSGSSNPNVHHYGKHGLVIHTAEVIKLALTNNDLLGLDLDKTQIILAGLYHDIGKLHDYRPLDDSLEEWEATDHKYKIHHISRSFAIWQSMATDYMYNPAYKDEVGHAILAHHGRLEWHSPVEPQTKLAWLLHLSDYMSAKLYDKAKYENIV